MGYIGCTEQAVLRICNGAVLDGYVGLCCWLCKRLMHALVAVQEKG